MRRLSAIFLSFVVVYSEGAYALAACSVRHRGHEHHASYEIGESSVDHHTMTEASSPQDSSTPVIHCVPLNQQVGATAQTASFQLTCSHRIIPLHAASFPDPLSPVLKNNLWLEALFKKILTFSLPNNLSRHLFLSILQI